MTEEFIRNRITELRLRRGVSEYQMSYDLGHSRGYVYKESHPELIRKALAGMRQLDEDDMLMLLGFINRLLKK